MTGIVGHAGLLLGGGWSPTQLTVFPSIFLYDGTGVSNVSGLAASWGSGGAFAAAFIQATSGSRPTINATGLNGLRTLSYDGTADTLSSNDTGTRDMFRNKSNGYIFFVGRKLGVDGAGINKGLVANAAGDSGGGGRLNLGTFENKPYVYSERVDGAGGVSLISTTALDTAFHMVMVSVDWAGNDAFIYIDGTQTDSNTSFGTTGSTSNTTSFWPSQLNSFLGTPPSSGFNNVEHACIIEGSNGLPTTDERNKLFGWAAWRYGLTSLLDVSHPYKNVRP